MLKRNVWPHNKLAHQNPTGTCVKEKCLQNWPQGLTSRQTTKTDSAQKMKLEEHSFKRWIFRLWAWLNLKFNLFEKIGLNWVLTEPSLYLEQKCTEIWSSFTKEIPISQFQEKSNFVFLQTFVCPISLYVRIFMQVLYWIPHSYKFLNVWYNRILGEINFPGFPESSHKYSLMGYKEEQFWDISCIILQYVCLFYNMYL